MTTNNKTNRRLMYAVLWLPVILTPIAYMFLSYVGDGAYHRNGFWHFAGFIFPFCVLFCIHHFLLVRKLFMRNRLKAYFISVVCLLAAFVVVDNLGTSNDLQPQPEDVPQEGMGINGDMRHAQGQPDAFRPAPPPPERPLGGNLNSNGPEPLAMDFCIALLLVGANLSAAMFVKYINEKERNADLERNRLQQELEYLKAQLNPHFFMNMLNNIHGMVEIDPSAAQEMIVELSRLMRYVLYEGAKKYIPLSMEMDFIGTYVALMRKRYSNKKISVNLQMPDPSQTAGIMLPPLLFIVPIENAFKHGISYLRHSEFDMAIYVADGYIRFHCLNSRGTPPDYAKKKSGGIGLVNLRKRLELLFGNDYSLVIDDKKTDKYEVTLTIPHKHDTDTLHSDR